MTLPNDKMQELCELLWTVRDGSCRPEDIERLEQLAATDPDVQKLCARFAVMCGLLHWSRRRPRESGAAPLVVLPAHHDASPPLGFLGHAMHGTLSYFSQVGPLSYLIATFIMLLMGVATWNWKLSDHTQIVHQAVPSPSPLVPGLSSRMQFVGRITGMVDCQWADPNTAVPGPVAVPLDRKYALASGLLEITYDSGAKVILQGPCTYEVESKTGGFLSAGKLTARVEKKGERREGRGEDAVQSTEYGVRSTKESGTIARHQSEILHPKSEVSPLSTLHSPLFAVRTPTAVVTDLGTEFGVEVDAKGVTTSHVFRGSVHVQVANEDGKASEPGQVLHENESSRVDASGSQADNSRIKLLGLSANPVGFVREIPTRTIRTLDLADIVAGGDGLSGKRNRGIDANTGRTSDVHPDTPELVDTQGDYKYHRVDGVPLVDGVFIPDGSRGPVQIDSAGHTFPDCPTTNNWSYAYIWAGGNLPPVIAPRVPTILGGIDYSSPEHSLLFVHSNKGITFNLDAIRQANPGYEVLRLRAVAGNVEPESAKGQAVSADIWVLVDGQVRFKRREFNSYSGVAPITIPIRPNDRFLTLAATDAGNSHMCDQIIFGDPRLELTKPKILMNHTE